MDRDSIIQMELLACDFWPARNRTRLSNGWILGENEGVTWRANCVIPYGNTQGLSDLDAIREAEELYDAKALPSAFKLTHAAPARLDEVLADRGYDKHMVTHVQARILGEIGSENSRGILDVDIKTSLDDRWLLKQAIDDRYRGSRLEVLRDLLNRIPGRSAYASISEGERLVSVGLGVVHRNWLALFSIRTDQEHRRQGMGRAISEALISWGKRNGAENSFLQVEADNLPAIDLYDKMRFSTA